VFIKALSKMLCRKKKFPFIISDLRNRNFVDRKELEILLIFYDSMLRDNVANMSRICRELFTTSRHIRVDIFDSVSF